MRRRRNVAEKRDWLYVKDEISPPNQRRGREKGIDPLKRQRFGGVSPLEEGKRDAGLLQCLSRSAMEGRTNRSHFSDEGRLNDRGVGTRHPRSTIAPVGDDAPEKRGKLVRRVDKPTQSWKKDPKNEGGQRSISCGAAKESNR